jgi:hypothetical protein
VLLCQTAWSLTSEVIDFVSCALEHRAHLHKEKEFVMSAPQSPFLRRALILDAAASGATAVLLIVAAGFLDGLLGLPVGLLRGAGLVLVPYVAFVVFVATRQRPEPAAVITIIASNALWAAASVLLLLSGKVAPTGLGIAFVLGQAMVVALLGELQYVGLRRPAAEIG